MGVISNLDVQTRLDVREVLSRFCHAIDHVDECGWARLFTMDAKFRSALCGDFVGRDEILALPRKMHELGEGYWRHDFTNIVIDRTESHRTLKVRAYCTVTDWSDCGKPVFFADCVIILRNTCQWQIAELTAQAVRADGIPLTTVGAAESLRTRPSVN
jgi:hypothetical protein